MHYQNMDITAYSTYLAMHDSDLTSNAKRNALFKEFIRRLGKTDQKRIEEILPDLRISVCPIRKFVALADEYLKLEMGAKEAKAILWDLKCIQQTAQK